MRVVEAVGPCLRFRLPVVAVVTTVAVDAKDLSSDFLESDAFEADFVTAFRVEA